MLLLRGRELRFCLVKGDCEGEIHIWKEFDVGEFPTVVLHFGFDAVEKDVHIFNSLVEASVLDNPIYCVIRGCTAERGGTPRILWGGWAGRTSGFGIGEIRFLVMLLFAVHPEFFAAADFDNPVFHAAPLFETLALSADEKNLLTGETARVAVAGALVVFAAVVDPNILGNLTGRKFVAAEDVGDDFAQRGVCGADVAVGAAGRAREELANGLSAVQGGEDGGAVMTEMAGCSSVRAGRFRGVLREIME
jgi:hypothetical protein